MNMATESEILRRLKTSHTNLEKSQAKEILITLSGELNSLGYSEEWVRNTLKSAMTGYIMIISKDWSGERKGHIEVQEI